MPFPVPKFHFEVTLLGSLLSFQEVTGLDQEAEHLEYRVGSDPEFVTEKRVGMLKTGNVSFKRGIITGETGVLDLWAEILDAKAYYSTHEPQDLEITLMDELGSPVASWVVRKAVPVKYSNADLKSEENAIAIESIDFVHSGVVATIM